MQKFDTITIQEMPKEDMLLIIHALDYTAKNTEIEDFLELKNNIIQELAALAEVPESEFIKFLEEYED
ncbi:MAG TPA: hypothetical protein VIG40_00390 [Tissierellaceae bacterium]